jgi:hypothetical protein
MGMYLLQVSDSALYTVWGVSLAIGLVVALVVAALLMLIIRTARQIHEVTSEIWVDGQRCANNTVHIPLLFDTNRRLTGILVHASGVIEGSERLKEHVETCPGCPECLAGGSGIR